MSVLIISLEEKFVLTPAAIGVTFLLRKPDYSFPTAVHTICHSFNFLPHRPTDDKSAYVYIYFHARAAAARLKRGKPAPSL